MGFDQKESDERKPFFDKMQAEWINRKRPDNPRPFSVPYEENIRGDKVDDERSREKKGKVNSLQRFRYVRHEKILEREKENSPDCSYKLLQAEQNLREVVQEESAIKEGIQPLSKDAQERLIVLNTTYWRLSQEWWHWRSALHPGPQERAFKLWRSHPKWYMHQELVKDCAGQDGCCARECGCCQNRQIDASRILGVGHCTLECECCRQARGFEISKEDKEKVRSQFRFDGKRLDSRLKAINMVSIFGLVSDHFRNPFEMIDVPPSYEQFETKEKEQEASHLIWREVEMVETSSWR
ncbi:unnamed protein product [Penicillium salamii]|uniref:Uncharacterized protein n=1 Tax=Penicillium salamii TaxID=1612424 RepID=A0A9W4JPL3_9EURO|nr:unnamed protein product [Penicillium salamii]